MSSGELTILVGTTKGAFLISGGKDRSGWSVKGPLCDGWPINLVIGDAETGTLWAGGGGDWGSEPGDLKQPVRTDTSTTESSGSLELSELSLGSAASMMPSPRSPALRSSTCLTASPTRARLHA